MELLYRYLLDHWITIHGLAVISGLAVYVTTSHTLHLRRHPSAAIVWVAFLIAFPYAALPLYLVFGIRKVKSYRSTSGKYEFAAQTSGPGSVPDRTRQLAAIMSLPDASSYRQLHIHQDGTNALQALRNMIAAAQHSIDLSTFIFARDNLGDEIAASLKRRARQGVRVRLLVDGIGAYLGKRANFDSLSAAGVQVALFVPPLRSSLRGRTNLRNHRKMVIADNEWLWCGGRNLATEYFEGDATTSRGSPPWVDLSFDLHGTLARQAEQQFEQDWAFATRRAIPGPFSAVDPAPRHDAAMGQLIASGPDQIDDTLYTLLVSGFFLSNKRIMVATPYFVPNPTLLMSLTLAARRGVAVDLLLPRKSNHRLADLARHRALRELTSAGGRVWILPDMIHAKAMVIDDGLALAGSANLDERSLFLNYELMVAFYEPSDVERFAVWIECQRKTAASYRAKPPGIWREVAEGMLLWLAFQL
ncbi:MAG TPA: phospholipase D-like domain-containing protein [Gallionella sp.]|nr:phospholipase D-like domain-containing protein [Gallionella sp.]